MAEEEQKPEKKVSVVMAVLLILAAVFIDILDLLVFLLNFVGIGVILTPIVSVLTFILFKVWFWAIDVKGIAPLATQIIGALVEAIPVVGALPLVTLTVIIVIILANSETVSKITDKVPMGKGAGMGSRPMAS